MINAGLRMGIFGLVVSFSDLREVSLYFMLLLMSRIGGITNGQEMVAEYIRENFSGPAANAVLAMADVGTKGINYPTGKSRETLWWLWQILRSITVGNGKHKSL